VFRRSLLLLSLALAATALPATSALAGEDDPVPAPPPPALPAPVPVPVPPAIVGSATLHEPQDCVSGRRVKATVSGDAIATVAFFVDGRLMRTVTRPAVTGRFVFSMRCSRVGVGAHRARAAVTFRAGASPARESLRFQITRSRRQSPQFTG
jgi:hypothetical protein